MKWRVVVSVLAYLLLIMGPCLAVPLVVALVYDQGSPLLGWELAGFGAPLTVSLGVGLWLRRAFEVSPRDMGRREGFAVVTFSWLVAVLFGMVPYLLVGSTHSVTDAFFETMSGYTTTGATIFSGHALESMPRGLSFWRCMTQWLGGMGIVVLSVALLSFLGVGGYRLLKAETPGGVAYERDRPRISDAAKDLWTLYVGMTVVLAIALKLAGATFFDAVCHAFTTMSTGGFSPHGDSLASFNPLIQWIIVVFMFAAGVNFSLHALLVRGHARQVLRNRELRVYASILLVVSLLGIAITNTGAHAEERVRNVVVQVVSIGTTTGYVTDDFDTWPQLMRWLMLGLFFTGGCLGSTAGGVKTTRWIVYTKAAALQLRLMIYPSAVRPIQIGDKRVEPAIVSNILAFGVLYAVCFFVGAFTMAACGYDVETAASASASALGNIGPGLAEVGPTRDWCHLPVVAKWIMSMLMLVGRLELFSVLILFTPWAWKR